MINQRYYKDLHYVWCSEVFDARAQYAYGPHASIPPSASPYEIYKTMRDDVRRGDLHSLNLKRLRETIANGAMLKREAGEISTTQYDDIGKILDGALLMDFRPLLYIIPYQAVSALIKEVPIQERAHPLSLELKISALPRELFDVIEVNYESTQKLNIKPADKPFRKIDF
jgi:hypothetical protein